MVEDLSDPHVLEAEINIISDNPLFLRRENSYSKLSVK